MLTGYEFLEAAYMAKMMSGGSGVTDNSIIAKIDESPVIAEAEIANGWTVRFKTVKDLTVTSISRQQSDDFYYVSHINEFTPIFVCAYKNGNFMFANEITVIGFSNETENSLYSPYSPTDIGVYRKKEWGTLTNPDDTNTFTVNELQPISDPQINVGGIASCTAMIHYHYANRTQEFNVRTGEVVSTRWNIIKNQQIGLSLFDYKMAIMHDLKKREDILIDLSDACITYLNGN